MTDFTETIRNFIQTEMLPENSKVTLSPSDSLIDNGIVDSLGVQILIGYLEREFDVHIVDTDIVPENFETIGSVVNFLNQKLGSRR